MLLEAGDYKSKFREISEKLNLSLISKKGILDILRKSFDETIKEAD
ncbi:MAG: hypothetical protein ACXQTP_06790 [Candidatus Methanofastidiosia archaeon]